MTKKEALQSLLTFPVKDSLVEKILTDCGIDGAVTYTKDHLREIDLAFAELLFFIINAVDETEGDWSIKINRSSLSSTREAILKKYDLGEENIICDPIW